MRISPLLIAAMAMSYANTPMPKFSTGKWQDSSMSEKDGVVTDSYGKKYQRQKNGELRRIK